MKSFQISGMSCSACASRVERAVSSLEGVNECSVNLLTKTMLVDADISSGQIIKAVRSIGFGIKESASAENDLISTGEASFLLKRLIISLGFLILLMYFSMGYTMWGLPLPLILESNPIIIAIIQGVLSATVMVINRRFFINGVRGALNGGANMDTLVSLGSFASYAYSVVMVILMINKPLDTQNHYLHGLYFESASMILALITLGKTLEAYSKGKTTSALKALMDLTPKTARVLVNGEEKIISAKDVRVGDVFIVKPGEAISADGVVIEGETTVNEATLTGESMPASKSIGDNVYSATINQNGYIKCKATKESGKTVLAEIIRAVKEASGTKAPVQRLADKVSGIFVPTVIAIAIITTVLWSIFGTEGFGHALERGVSVLVISCPCALGLATPVAIMVGSGIGAKNGILFKNATAQEQVGKINILALDKTGTITKGEPQITDTFPVGCTERELLEIAHTVENQSEHPLARAIVAHCRNLMISPLPVYEFTALAGEGVRAKAEIGDIIAGKPQLISTYAEINSELENKIQELLTQGKTVMLFALNNRVMGAIAVSDTLKEDSATAIEAIKKMGITPVMITGDNELSAKEIASQVGIERVIAGVLPNQKLDAIKELKTQGAVCMVGDGINDASALTEADIGIAIGNGSDIAIGSSEIVLTKGSLSDIPFLIQLSKRVLRTIKQNLFWAFIYNLIGIPLAIGAFSSWLGWELNPMFGALAMSLSSLFVVTNALRLNLFKPKELK